MGPLAVAPARSTGCPSRQLCRLGVETDRLGHVRADVVVVAGGIDRVGRLHDFPGEIGLHDGILENPVPAALEALFESRLVEGRSQGREVVPAGQERQGRW